MHHLAWAGLLDGGLKLRPMTLPDRYIDHNTPKAQMDDAALSVQHIVNTVTQALTARSPELVPSL